MKRLLFAALVLATATLSAQTIGVWQNITPSVIPLGGSGGNNCDYGTLAIALDPITPSTIYLGSCQHGVFKSLDSGATWRHINTGTNGLILDQTRQWTMAVDPINPQVVYTNSGYGGGTNNGAWKSSDGGVNWARIWPPLNQSALVGIVAYDFVAQIALDWSNHNHVLLSFHGSCAAPYTATCYAESQDAGGSWVIRNGDPRWIASESQTIYAVDAQRWLFANHADGLWVTVNAGQTWTLINSQAAGHWPSTLYRSSTGVFYIGADNGVYRSADFVNWSPVTFAWGMGYLVNGIIGDGTTLYAANAGSLTPWVSPGTNVYMTAPEATGTNWTLAPWPVPPGQWTQGSGGGFAYDPIRHYLYSSNGTVGLWRIQTSAAAPPPPPPPPPPDVCESVVRLNGVIEYVAAALSVCNGAHP